MNKDYIIVYDSPYKAWWYESGANEIFVLIIVGCVVLFLIHDIVTSWIREIKYRISAKKKYKTKNRDGEL